MEEENDITYIGTANRHGYDQTIGIKNADRHQHIHIIGKTGVGKTSLLKNLIVQDRGGPRNSDQVLSYDL